MFSLKKRFILISLVLIGLFSLVLLAPQVFAQDITLPFDTESVKNLPTIGLEISGVGKGVSGFREVINVVGSFLAIVLRAVAVLMIFVAGYQLD